jgi:hypothetical protein
MGVSSCTGREGAVHFQIPPRGYLFSCLKAGARLFATLTTGFALLAQLDADFTYWHFAGSILIIGLGMGLFQSPNTSSIMSAVPDHQRGVASGMRATLQNSGMVLSLILFFT